MARRGRRPKGEYPEKKRVFASRIREDTWEMLQRAAAKSGRSLSQEFEFRLRRSLDDDEKIESAFGDLKTFGLMKLAAQAVKSMCDLNNLKVHWTANVTAFDEALEVITRTLKGFRQLTATTPKHTADVATVTSRTAWLRSDSAAATRTVEISFGTNLPVVAR